MIHPALLDRLCLQRGGLQNARDRGFARVRLPSRVVLHDVAVCQKNGTAWASPASKPMVGRDRTGMATGFLDRPSRQVPFGDLLLGDCEFLKVDRHARRKLAQPTHRSVKVQKPSCNNC